MVLYVILLFLIGLMHQASADPAGWLEHRRTYYYFSTEQQTPTDARSTCQASGMDIVLVFGLISQSVIKETAGIGQMVLRIMQEHGITGRTGSQITVPTNVPDYFLMVNGEMKPLLTPTNLSARKRIFAQRKEISVHGTCHVLHDRNEYRCDCYQDYSGRYCETEINSCRSNPCGTGQCTDGNNTFTCDCTGTGFQGGTCNEDIDECESGAMRCLKGGSCENIIGSARCICVAGKTGQMCEMGI